MNKITETIENLKECADTIDNLLSARTLPLSDALHLQGLTESLLPLKRRIQNIVFQLRNIDVFVLFGKDAPGGTENPWKIREIYLEERNADNELKEILTYGPNCVRIEKYKIKDI